MLESICITGSTTKQGAVTRVRRISRGSQMSLLAKTHVPNVAHLEMRSIVSKRGYIDTK